MTNPTRYRDTPPKARPQPRVVRTSTLEVAIRAQAKRFLAHPAVVQHLEAIWAGTIVFHSAADNLHRPLPKAASNARFHHGRKARSGSNTGEVRPNASSLDQQARLELLSMRRSVTLYDPRDASLFKLSRLRVPRYRQFMSTCSFAVLLCLYLAVLVERSLQITTLEMIFWFWSAGFMLDEIVGFNEQGFSLYIMSFWNSFDLGILLLLIIYYVLRLYGILAAETDRHGSSGAAYDVLAATAVLLFPRLFSVLDHYPYFSQLLIAFRLMAIDLVAVFVLIMISCSGFFVAFTLSFGKDDYNASAVAYSLFQMILGFTPAAWNIWDDYNILGKIILTLFLFICHFLIVTILITVLTNSFMAIVANANEEHQFLFAVNTISMVKSDALFSYIAPTNIIAWLLTPLRYVISFRSFVKLNRTVIKMTHFPILLGIYLYERIVLRMVAFEPTDLVENSGLSRRRTLAHDTTEAGTGLFHPTTRWRQWSQAGLHKDRALEEVFRRPFKDATLRTYVKTEHRRASNAVKSWMQDIGPDGRASPPLEQDRIVVDRLEARKSIRRPSYKLVRRVTSATRDYTDATRSVVSDPEEFTSNSAVRPSARRTGDGRFSGMKMDEDVEMTGAEGDDEQATNDEEEEVVSLGKQKGTGSQEGEDATTEADPLRTPTATKYKTPPLPRAVTLTSPKRLGSPLEAQATRWRMAQLARYNSERDVSSGTTLIKPVQNLCQSSVSPPKRSTVGGKAPAKSGMSSPKSPGRRSPRKPNNATTKPLPIIRPGSRFQSAPNLAGLVVLDKRHQLRHRTSSLAFDLTSELGNNITAQLVGGVPSSFATQMAIATGAVRAPPGGAGEDIQILSRLMLARMKTLEEGFNEVLKEVKHLRRDGESSGEGVRLKDKKTRRVADQQRQVEMTSDVEVQKSGDEKPEP